MSVMSQLAMEIQDAVYDNIVGSAFTGESKSFEQLAAEFNCPVEWIEDCYNHLIGELYD